jgi:hypothetical protein
MTSSLRKQDRIRKRGYRKHLSTVTTGGTASSVRQAIEAARDWAKQDEEVAQAILENIALRRKAAQLEWDGTDPVGPPQPRGNDAYVYGSRALLFLEIGTAAFLGAQVFAFPTPVAAAAGVVVTGVLFYSMRAALQVCIVDGPRRAQEKFRLLQRTFAIAFTTWAASITGMLSITRLPALGGDTAQTLAVLLLTVIALAAPAAAAALAMARHVRIAPDAEADLYVRLQTALDRIKTLRMTCDRVEAQLGGRRNHTLVA